MIENVTNSLLRRVFEIKGNFARGVRPGNIAFDGVAITPFPGTASASATISADFELEWAFRGLSLEEQKLMGVRTRTNMPILLRILEEQSIPITWATVGHLFLECCERGPCGLAHPHMPRPPKNPHWDGDWYRHDPCSNLEKDPGWYAPDLIAQILSSGVPHEIGMHSFSHIDFSPDTSDRTLVRRELEESAAVMDRFGLSPKSLVYPRNSMGHQYLDVLGDLKVTSVRHRDAAVRLSYPERSESGVYKLYESMNLRRGNGYNYLNKAKIFLAQAVQAEAAYHFWFHPSDPTEVFEQEFSDIIRYLAERRNLGEIWVATMRDLTAYCEARQTTRLDVRRDGGSLQIRFDSRYDVARYGPVDITLRIPVSRQPKKCVVRSGDKQWRIEGKPATIDAASDEAGFLYAVPVTAKEMEVVL